jgi:hypothetical protein
MVKSEYHSFRKKSALFQGKVALLPNLTLPPTSHHLGAGLKGDDYGWKASITFKAKRSGIAFGC